MSDFVISVEGLGKKYRIRHQGTPRYVALRDVVVDKITTPVRWIRDKRRTGNGNQSAPVLPEVPTAATVPRTVVRLQKTESAVVRSLERDALLVERVERLMSIPAVGPITALTWALEIGDVFPRSRKPSVTAGCVEQKRVLGTRFSAHRFRSSAINTYRPR